MRYDCNMLFTSALIAPNLPWKQAALQHLWAQMTTTWAKMPTERLLKYCDGDCNGGGHVDGGCDDYAYDDGDDDDDDDEDDDDNDDDDLLTFCGVVATGVTRLTNTCTHT